MRLMYRGNFVVAGFKKSDIMKSGEKAGEAGWQKKRK